MKPLMHLKKTYDAVLVQCFSVDVCSVHIYDMYELNSFGIMTKNIPQLNVSQFFSPPLLSR